MDDPIPSLKRSSDPLAQSILLAGQTVQHRIALAPMTRMRASDDGIPNASAAAYYAARTTPGGFLISEGVVVHARGKGFPNTPGLWTREQVDGWAPITKAVRKKGGLFFAQLW
jgi:2,4-dienoyl-CoA reductase-like NADH-dependent reductase (Old Yellow Enzyme family)